MMKIISGHVVTIIPYDIYFSSAATPAPNAKGKAQAQQSAEFVARRANIGMLLGSINKTVSTDVQISTGV